MIMNHSCFLLRKTPIESFPPATAEDLGCWRKVVRHLICVLAIATADLYIQVFCYILIEIDAVYSQLWSLSYINLVAMNESGLRARSLGTAHTHLPLHALLGRSSRTRRQRKRKRKA